MKEKRTFQNFSRNQFVKLIVVLSLVLVALLVTAVACREPAKPNLTLMLSIDGPINLEYGESYTPCDAYLLLDGEKVEAEITCDIPKLDKLGSVSVTYTAEYDGQTVRASHTVNVVDTQPPVLTLLQIPGHFTEIGSEYVEEGFLAQDNYDGDLSASVQIVKEGNTIRYTVSDSSGNIAQQVRTIVYGDTTPPVITLTGEDSITITAGTQFTEPGFVASDNVDGDLTANVTVTGEYDKYRPGTYTFTYTVTDAHGNTAQVSRTLIVEGIKQPPVVDPGDKIIYLTFDDGPSQYTPKLLEILEKYNIKATFYVVGTARLEYLDDIVNAGHSIGIHTNTHEYSQIYSSVDAFFDDFFAIREKIYQYTGVYTNLSRFPGGSANSSSKKYCPGIMTQLAQMLTDMGFHYCDWNIDSKDAVGATTAEEVYQNVINGIQGKKVAYVLQHDIKGYSVDAVEKIIQWGLANGYTFLALEESSPMCHQNIQN